MIGLGAIGGRVANMAEALGMRVIGYDPHITVSQAWQLSAKVQQMRSIDELLAQSDFVSPHVPLNDTTRNLLNAERLCHARENLTLLNFARAGVINDAAVCDALSDGRLHAYVTDFPSLVLQGHDRVITLPHLGASTL